MELITILIATNIALVGYVVILKVRLKKYLKAIVKETREVSRARRELEKVKKDAEKKEKQLMTSIENLKGAIQEENGMYVHELKDGQLIAVRMDIELVNEDSQEMGFKFLRTSSMDCTVFIDKTKMWPLSLDPIIKGNTRYQIQDINCHPKCGLGIGTYVLQDLEKEIKAFDEITELYVKLSTVDFDAKDCLYNFYINKNGFKVEKELQENSWGRLSKDIRKKV